MHLLVFVHASGICKILVAEVMHMETSIHTRTSLWALGGCAEVSSGAMVALPAGFSPLAFLVQKRSLTAELSFAWDPVCVGLAISEENKVGSALVDCSLIGTGKSDREGGWRKTGPSSGCQTSSVDAMTC